MTLTSMKITDFLSLLGSAEPAPGGGSAAALASSMGAALSAMVAHLTIGKKKYEEHDSLNREALEQLEAVLAQLERTIDEDTEAFNGVSAVFAMPKETDEEKTARREAMQEALKAAVAVPFRVMTLGEQAVQLTAKLVGKSNPNAASDLGVAALNLKAGVHGAWLNVLINLSGIRDEAFVADYRQKGAAVLKQASEVADSVTDAIVASLEQ